MAEDWSKRWDERDRSRKDPQVAYGSWKFITGFITGGCTIFLTMLFLGYLFP